MEFECKLSNAEMREAYRLNQSWRYWAMLIRLNLEVAVLAVAILAGIVTSIAKHHDPNWGDISIALAFMALILGVYWWRFSRKFTKMARRASAACERMTVNANGIGALAPSGATNFSSWSQYKRWKEGKFVFTVSDGKAFRTIPKSAMSEMQVGEVRGILQTQIRQTP